MVARERQKMKALYHTTYTEHFAALEVESRETYLYVFKNKKSGLFKIGVSCRPYTRMLSLLADSEDSFCAQLYGRVVPYQERFLIERHVHSCLSKYRKFGEWFDFGDKVGRVIARVISIILSIMKDKK